MFNFKTTLYHWRGRDTGSETELEGIFCEENKPVCGNHIKEYGEVCDGGNKCSNTCDVKCSGDAIWKDNKCQVPQEPLPTCADDEILQDNVCVQRCGEGETWDGSECKIAKVCPTGYRDQAGSCVKDFLGGSVHPLAMDSNCQGAKVVYSGGISEIGDYGDDDYGDRPSYGDFHYGVDIRSSNGGDACKVNAVAKGAAGSPSVDGNGANWIDIKHDDTYTTRYIHGSDQLLKTGELVTYNDFIFTMGCTGRCDGRHLHFELFVDGIRNDPQKYFGYMGGEHNTNYLPDYAVDLENKIFYVTKRY